MSTRRDKPREYFAKLLDTPEEAIDYSEIPATIAADWENAEVLFPVNPQACPTSSLADQSKLWLEQEIWPQILAMMHNDGYFRLWFKAQELAGVPQGPMTQMVVNGYVTYQLAVIRRLCDNSRDAISLPKLLRLIKREQPFKKAVLITLGARLEKEVEEVVTLATQHVAHNGNPARPDWRQWSLTSEQITIGQRAICEVAVIIERDLLAITQRTHLIPVPQFDYLAELRVLMPPSRLRILQDFCHAHNESIDAWLQVQKLTSRRQGVG